MSNDWTQVTRVGNIQKAEFIKGMLNENGIEANILNKRDSEIPSIGEVEIYVMKSDVAKAKQLIDEHNKPE